MSDFTDRVQTAVAGRYSIERELGGGGMSRVLLAEETGLERKVVIKVLPPEMAAGVNADRFRREILLAAKLQHPHIVPLLTAGASGDLLYFVMPYIEGESLRTRVTREGELPVGQAVRILRDVADALAYAHSHGVVHRDIKPDNVLLAHGHAVVTDFGVAKAVASSTGESSLTSLGVALGTPAYMSPEQAAADPHVDHRADLYALGVMAYEMLTSRPPFTGATAQTVLAAQVTQAPDPVTAHRGTVPPALAEAVMRCLAKKPADRFQRAEELIPVFDSLLTPGSGITPPATRPVPAVRYEAQARRAHPARVGALFALAGVGVAAILYALVHAFGLPDWVFLGGLGLLLLGFPVVVLTGAQERQRALASATGMPALTPTGMKKLFTWRRASWGGAVAFTALALLAGSFMTLRALGVGPFGTLLTSGRLAERAKVLVADFRNTSADPTLGHSLTEAFRIDLSQSPVVRVMTGEEVRAVLSRMERPESTAVTQEVAREIAERQGIPALIVGGVASVGQGYLLSARVLATGDGSELAAARETAESETALLPALSRLSTAIRARIGESYRSLRNTAPLEAVTTPSLAALRLYTRAGQAELTGDMSQAAELYRQATTVDTSFAMAYRKLAAMLSNNAAPASQVAAAASAALRHSDRLPPVERGLAEGFYFTAVVDDPGRAIAAYRDVAALDPDQNAAQNNLASELAIVGHWTEAESAAARALVAGDSGVFQNFLMLTEAQFNQGRAADAERTFAALHRKLPNLIPSLLFEGILGYAEGRWDSTASIARRVAADATVPAPMKLRADQLGAAALTVQGRLGDAAALAGHGERLAAASRDSGGALDFAAERAVSVALLAGDTARARDLLAAALRRYPLERLPASDRPWMRLVAAYAFTGQVAQARALLDRWTREVPSGRRDRSYGLALGLVLAAEGKPAAARTAFQVIGDSLECNACTEPWIGRTWEAQGFPDSALVHYERYLAAPEFWAMRWDSDCRPWILRRAGELNAQLGRRREAIERLTRFLDLWKNADPGLQPAVREARAQIARLAAAGS